MSDERYADEDCAVTPETAADAVSKLVAEMAAPMTSEEYRDFLLDLQDRISTDIDAHQETCPEVWRELEDTEPPP